jgi:hypothetical protein
MADTGIAPDLTYRWRTGSGDVVQLYNCTSVLLCWSAFSDSYINL